MIRDLGAISMGPGECPWAGVWPTVLFGLFLSCLRSGSDQWSLKMLAAILFSDFQAMPLHFSSISFYYQCYVSIVKIMQRIIDGATWHSFPCGLSYKLFYQHQLHNVWVLYSFYLKSSTTMQETFRSFTAELISRYLILISSFKHLVHVIHKIRVTSTRHSEATFQISWKSIVNFLKWWIIYCFYK